MYHGILSLLCVVSMCVYMYWGMCRSLKRSAWTVLKGGFFSSLIFTVMKNKDFTLLCMYVPVGIIS